ncbi:MAG: ATP-binding cassette domain-containing protein [Lachnospiraceae bacterium]|nr:ATP-binding cassette domain-containing protein [Lachnospiraceae bacterium]
MSERKIPAVLLSMLENEGISQAQILAYSPIDLSFECEYVYGYVFLTKKHLGVATSAPISSHIIYMKGTQKKDDVSFEEKSEYSYRLYEVDKIEKLHREHMVATNLICMEYDGKPVRLAAHTNLHLADMEAFLKKYKQFIHGEQITEEEAAAEPEELYCPVCGTKYPDEERKICPKCMNKRSIFMRTFRYFLRYKWMIAVLAFCYVASALVSLAWPYLSGTVLYDWVLDKNDTYLAPFGLQGEYALALILLVGCMLVAKILQQTISIVQGSIMARIVATSIRDMKQDIFASMGELSLRFFTSKQTGNLMTRVLGDAERVTGFFLDGFPYIFVHSFTILASFIVMFRLNWQMASVACVLLPLLVVISVKLKPRIWSLFGRRHRAERAVNTKVNDNLTGSRVVKAFGQQGGEIDRFEGPNDYLRDAEVRIEKYNNRFTILYNLVQEISAIWVWLLGVFMMMQTNRIEVGILITFVGYVAQLNGPMNFFSRVFRLWSDSINAAQRMFEIMDSIPEIKEAQNPIALTEPKGEIKLTHVSFGYDKNRQILKDIDFDVKPGEVLGIVGRSGAGKTTLVSLISRLYDVDDGKIEIDGIDVKELAFRDLRRNVAMVSQDTYIFMGTVADNIAYGNPEATREEIMQAAMLASAHDFISRMPDGYDTVIGAAGKDLSGGEKQRLSIARAVLANPKILILDEATASVDTETEKAIQKALDYLVQGRTTLSIAHRISTLKNADRLIVIDSGRVVESGTHSELMELNGVYAKLVELQTKSLSLEEVD